MDTHLTLLVALGIAGTAVAIVVAVRVFRSGKNPHRLSAVGSPGDSTSGAATGVGPASIVTELLADTKVGELMNDAIPLDPLSELAAQINAVAGPAVQAALIANPVALQRGRFLVEFTAEGTSALKSGSVSLLQRVDGRLQPTLINKASKFEENAKLVTRGSRAALRVGAVAHVVVLLAVQAQLVSMERTLARMEAKLDALRRFLDDEQVARVRGWLKKLVALRDELTDSPSDADTQRVLAVLDAADAEFLQVEELAKRQCDRATTGMKSAKLAVEWFGPQGQTLLEAFLNEVASYQRYSDLRTLAIAGRLVVAHLKRACGKDPAVAQLRRDIEGLAEAAASHHDLLEGRSNDFKTKFVPQVFEELKREEVRKIAAGFREGIEGVISGLHVEVRRLEGGSKRTASAIVEIGEDGGVRPVALLPEPRAGARLCGPDGRETHGES